MDADMGIDAPLAAQLGIRPSVDNGCCIIVDIVITTSYSQILQYKGLQHIPYTGPPIRTNVIASPTYFNHCCCCIAPHGSNGCALQASGSPWWSSLACCVLSEARPIQQHNNKTCQSRRLQPYSLLNWRCSSKCCRKSLQFLETVKQRRFCYS